MSQQKRAAPDSSPSIPRKLSRNLSPARSTTIPVPNSTAIPMSILPTASKHVLTSPGSSPSGPPPAKRSRFSTSVVTPLHFRRPTINATAQAAGFPEFPDGDVEIILPSGKRYLVHKAVLSLNSEFFRESLSQIKTMRSNGDGGGWDSNKDDSPVKYRYRMRGKGQDAILVLQDPHNDDDVRPQTPTEERNDTNGLTNDDPPTADSASDPTSCFNCGHTLADLPHSFDPGESLCPSCGQPSPADPSGFDQYQSNAYDNLLLIFYNFTPVYIYRSKTPAEQCFFRLVSLADQYRCLRAISSRLDHDLQKLGDTLWLHIFWDPLAYLALSLKIRSAPIFREATIHIIGRGHLVTHSKKLQQEYSPAFLIALHEKYTTILRSQHAIERQIRALNYPGDPTLYDHDTGDEINWLALSLWRSFESDLTARIYGRDVVPIQGSMERPELSAEYFRTLHQGGEKYLMEAEISKFLSRGYSQQLGDETASGFRRDILMLKEQVREIVGPLCRNESRLGLSELERRGGNYLTCVSWREEELPWAGEEEVW